MEDYEIVDLYLTRDQSAIEKTSEKFGSRLKTIAFRITEDYMTAEECENDTYWETWKRVPPHDPRDYFFPFLARIIRNIALNRCFERDRLKRKAAVTDISNELEQCIPSVDTIESILHEKDMTEYINRFLKGCPKDKRILFIRRYFYIESISSLSKDLGLSESNVKTTLFRLRKSLREELEKEGFKL